MNIRKTFTEITQLKQQKVILVLIIMNQHTCISIVNDWGEAPYFEVRLSVCLSVCLSTLV